MGLLAKFFGPPEKDKFARLVIDGLHMAGEQQTLRYEPEEFRVVIEGDAQNVFNLHNAYAEYCAVPRSQRASVLGRFIRTWLSRHKEIPDDIADAQTDLLPVLRSRSHFELVPLQLKVDSESELKWPHRVIGQHLGLGLAYDLPEAMHMVADNRLQDWKVTLDEALAVALQNLSAISQHRLESVAPGLWRSPWRDNYDAARLVLLDLLHRHEVDGDLIAMVPNRDTLLLAGSKDDAALEEMVRLAEEALQGPRSLSGLAFRLIGDEWRPYLPQVDGPLQTRFKMLEVKSHGQEYDEQKELLERLHQKTAEDIFLASYIAIQDTATGRVQSYCVWPEGVDSLLPRTDTIAFMANNGEEGEILGRVAWERVQQIAGKLMKPAGYPELYRASEFPTKEQLAAMGLEPLG